MQIDLDLEWPINLNSYRMGYKIYKNDVIQMQVTSAVAYTVIHYIVPHCYRNHHAKIEYVMTTITCLN